MNRKLYQSLILLMWLALPLTALKFWTVWDRLPVHMATHFDANWRANGWMARESALGFALGITALMLIVFTTIMFIVSRQKATTAVSWVMLTFSYVVTGFIFFINLRVVDYNLSGQPIHASAWMLILPVAVLMFIAAFLTVQRGKPLPPSDLLAEEAHGSPFLGVMLFALAAVAFYPAAQTHLTALYFASGIVSMLLVISGLAAWGGFHYLFMRHGLEIRALGFRLRSIPADEIERYGVDSWNILRGYGIRGVGNHRAYVWGNSGVNIATSQGAIFLGHSTPERIMHDLDLMKGDTKGRQMSPA